MQASDTTLSTLNYQTVKSLTKSELLQLQPNHATTGTYMFGAHIMIQEMNSYGLRKLSDKWKKMEKLELL